LIIKSGAIFQCQFGLFQHDAIVGKSFGTKWLAEKGQQAGAFIYVLHPTPHLWTSVLSHRTQIIYSLDAAFISFALNLKPGSIVIESGRSF
jgi:tRNA (adenine57-N1/adenine58-N1)-methyltransferase catalytic subunit